MMNTLQEIWDLLGQNAANVIAVCAFLATAYQAYLSSKHNRLSLRPHISDYRETQPFTKEGNSTITWRLTNHGPGSAKIKSYELSFDGGPINVNSSAAILRAMNEAIGVVAPTSYFGRLGTNSFLPGGASVTVLHVEFPTPDLNKMTALTDIDRIFDPFERFRVLVRYESIYEEGPFTFDSNRK